MFRNLSKVTHKACPLLVLGRGQGPGEAPPGLLCPPALGAAVEAAPFPPSFTPCVLGVSLMRLWSWQVMEGQALLCPCLSLRRHIFFNELCKCLRVRTKSGPPASPSPHSPDLVCLVGEFSEGCGGGLPVATSWFNLASEQGLRNDSSCDLGPVTSLPVPHLHSGNAGPL